MALGFDTARVLEIFAEVYGSDKHSQAVHKKLLTILETARLFVSLKMPTRIPPTESALEKQKRNAVHHVCCCLGLEQVTSARVLNN